MLQLGVGFDHMYTNGWIFLIQQCDVLCKRQHVKVSSPKQGSVRPSFDFRDRVWDWTFQGLNFKTESDTKIFLVSVLRPSLRLEFPESQFWDWVQDSNFLSPKSQFWDWVRVYFLNYQFQDRIRDWNFSKYQDWVWDQESLSLSHELSLRLVVPVSQLWGRVRDWSFASFLIKI